jgi:methanethiol oxidase
VEAGSHVLRITEARHGRAAEKLAYVALLNPAASGRTPSASSTSTRLAAYGTLVGQADMPVARRRAAPLRLERVQLAPVRLCAAPHMERRYLVVPGIAHRASRSSTRSRTRAAGAGQGHRRRDDRGRTGYTTPHTTHCGPDGIYVNALGGVDGDGPGGIFMLDHETFDVKGAWERSAAAVPVVRLLVASRPGHDDHQRVGHAEHGEGRLNPELLLAGKYGHALHVWDLRKRKHLQTLDLGAEQQMVLELRPAHDPAKAYGFAGVVISLEDLSRPSGCGTSRARTGQRVEDEEGHQIPAEPASPDDLPPMLKGFGAVPPLVTDLNLSLDDRFLYVSCWGTGEMLQYDVSIPFEPKLTAACASAASCARTPHPSQPDLPLNGGPQMVEISRDGRACLLHELAVLAVGRAVLSGRREELDGEARCRRGRRHGVRREVLRARRRPACGAPGAAAGRRRVLRLVLLLMSALERPVLGLVALGAVHGVNPAMGWLFAVALGLQERRARAVWRALPPLALGHAWR